MDKMQTLQSPIALANISVQGAKPQNGHGEFVNSATDL